MAWDRDLIDRVETGKASAADLRRYDEALADRNETVAAVAEEVVRLWRAGCGSSEFPDAIEELARLLEESGDRVMQK